MKRFLLSLILLLGITVVYADVSFKATAPSAVAAGQQFRVEYSVNDNASDIRVDIQNKGFEVLYGPATGTMSSTSIVNGKMTSSLTTTFTYTLMAEKEGTYTIPSATVKVGGKPYTSNSVTIKVLPADQSAGSNGSASHNSEATSNGSSKVNKEDFQLNLELSKTNAYEGEAIVATLKLYFRNTPIRSISDAKLPDFDGFTAQDMELGEDRQATLEHYKGSNYQMYPVQQWLLFPSRTGEITIPAAYIKAVAQVVTRRSAGGWFDFPMDYTSNVEIPLYSPARTVNVKALPANKPASYSNGVGDFTIKSELTSNHVKANDAVIYRITISGTGNLKYVNDPEPAFPSDFEVYDPKDDLSSKATSQGVTGQKTIEYTVIPRHPGTFEIPAVEFSYFDVKSGQYKTLTTDSYSMEVEKGSGDSSSEGNVSNYAGTNQERLKVLGNDIRYIHSLDSKDLKKDNTVFFGSLVYWLLFIIPLIIFIVISIIYRRQLKLNSDYDLKRNRKANKVANKRLKEASAALSSKNASAFYEAVHKAMFGYISDKLSMPISEISTDSVKEKLKSHNVSDEVIASYEDVISTCEYARYAPANDDQAMDQLYKKASDTLNNLESQIKK